ncbi:MAG: hypothetical protein ISS70_17535 [Phycisphaerae bacterium]|nr:hypothetical protein [Phycisphaerae bacterium]
MTDFLFQMGLSNACLSLALAIVAMVVGAKARRPQLAHMLWLFVFIKLVTPPIVKIPIITIPQQPETTVAINDHSTPGPQLTNSREFDVDVQLSGAWNRARVWLPPVWLMGSVVVFAWSMVRVCRFSRLLAKRSDVAPQELQNAAAKIARRLGLNTIPTICTTSARISPMVWWSGGKVRVVIPATLLDQMDAQQSQWILAHELAHVRRRDYLVRWLEWLACVCFWWNPVVWWAQRNLRAMEEICCDELVISCLNPKPKTYANSLLSAVEFLARPALRPPAMASEVNSGGFLERRFKMIVSENSKRSNTRWLQICVLLCAMVVLPVGIALAQDYEAVERRLGEAVGNGELSLAQAGVMMDALRKAGGARKQPAKSKSDTDLESASKKLKAMVKAGELTQEQATAKMSAIKKAGAEKNQDSDPAKVYLMKVKEELGSAVEAGRISKEDAARRYEAAVKRIGDRMAAGRRQRGGDKQREYEGFERRIKAAVEAGKMTREEAREKLAGFRRRMEMIEQAERGEKRISREDYARAEADLKKLVAEDKISEEDAKARLNGLRKIIAEQGERGKRRITVEEYKRAEAKMRKMIDEGKAKPEDVERRLIEMRKMIGDQSKPDGKHDDREPPDWEGIKRRIEGAVKSGDMTREEADAKYKAIRERLGQKVKEKDAKDKYGD